MTLTAKIKNKDYWHPFYILIVAWVLFLIGLHQKQRFGFDESHYVNAAKTFLTMQGMRNLEHPPLGKEIIAVGLYIFRDNPLGWRIMSSLAGVATIAGMMFWANILFNDRKKMLQVGILSLSSGLIYIQAQTAMLDTFMGAFLVWTCAYFTKFLQAKNHLELSRNIFFTSIFLGLTVATKWFGLVLTAGLFGLIVLFYSIQYLKIPFPFLQKDQFPKLILISPFKVLILFFTPAVLIYFSTFIPYFFYTDSHKGFMDLFTMQSDMLNHLNAVKKVHGYESHWTTWLLMKKPVCYFHSPTGDGLIKYVFAMVNPMIQWGGLIALFASLMKETRDRTLRGFLILSFFFMFYFCWAFFTRRLSFFYYFYPASFILIFAIVDAFERYQKAMKWFVGVTIVLFILYYPIWSAIPFPLKWLKYWLWFRVR